MTDFNMWIMIFVIAGVTTLLRFLPFILFKGDKKTPYIVEKAGRILPYCVMGMLVVYCLKNVNFKSAEGFLPELISSFVVCILYVWKRNTLLSIITGTVCYMIFVQLVF